MPKDKLNILMVNYEFPPIGGGGGKVCYELCKQLVADGNNVDVLTMGFKDLPRIEASEGINIFRVRCLRKYRDICRFHELASFIPTAILKGIRLLRNKDYDIIHCHFVFPSGPVATVLSKIFNKPLVITCHGTDVPDHNPYRFQLAHKLLLPLWKSIVSKHTITSPSSSLKKLILSKSPNAKVMVIPNGIHLTDYCQTTKKNKILMCSRLLPSKGFKYGIRALSDIPTDWSVDVIGEGPERENLENLAAGFKIDINFHGWLDNKSDKFKELYEQASIFIFPSEVENFPTVLLEAMAAKLAIITTPNGGNPEVAGDAAIYVQTKNAKEIALKTSELINNPQLRYELGESAFKRVQQFKWNTIAKKYESLYESILSR